eukprot:scaffold49619_cov17-Tisochrysis_lutea.AAC.1
MLTVTAALLRLGSLLLAAKEINGEEEFFWSASTSSIIDVADQEFKGDFFQAYSNFQAIRAADVSAPLNTPARSSDELGILLPIREQPQAPFRLLKAWAKASSSPKPYKPFGMHTSMSHDPRPSYSLIPCTSTRALYVSRTIACALCFLLA